MLLLKTKTRFLVIFGGFKLQVFLFGLVSSDEMANPEEMGVKKYVCFFWKGRGERKDLFLEPDGNPL